MRTLYLLRHAKSSWDDAGLEDFDRPLAQRGVDASARIADHMRAEGIAPEVVLCSPAVRAKETLAVMGPAVGDARIELEKNIYEATEADLVTLLHRLETDVHSALLIGHNPSVQRLTLLLCADGEGLDQVRAKYPTAALATLAIPKKEWRHLHMGDATLSAFVRPKELG